jgi:hypothetical protein
MDAEQRNVGMPEVVQEQFVDGGIQAVHDTRALDDESFSTERRLPGQSEETKVVLTFPHALKHYVQCVNNGTPEHLCVIAIGMLNGNKKVVEEFAHYQGIHKHLVQKSSKKVHWGDEHTLRHQKQCEHNGTSKELCTMAIGLLNGNKEANEAFLRYQLDGIDSNLEEKFSEFTAYRQLEDTLEILDNDSESNTEAVNVEEDSSKDSDDSDERRLQALIV